MSGQTLRSRKLATPQDSARMRSRLGSELEDGSGAEGEVVHEPLHKNQRERSSHLRKRHLIHSVLRIVSHITLGCQMNTLYVDFKEKSNK